jgi:hypothetical protein
MGLAWVFKERILEAQYTMHEQDTWCDSAQQFWQEVVPGAHLSALQEDANLMQIESLAQTYLPTTIPFKKRYPAPLKEDSLIALLRGDVKLNIHCYEV